MQEQPQITIVGAVYKTVVTSGDAFQHKIEQKQDAEKRAEEDLRKREILSTVATTAKQDRDVVDLSKGAAAQPAPSASVSPKAVAPATQPVTAPPSSTGRGQTLNTVA